MYAYQKRDVQPVATSWADYVLHSPDGRWVFRMGRSQAVRWHKTVLDTPVFAGYYVQRHLASIETVRCTFCHARPSQLEADTDGLFPTYDCGTAQCMAARERYPFWQREGWLS